jgi:hypothetical protein
VSVGRHRPRSGLHRFDRHAIERLGPVPPGSILVFRGFNEPAKNEAIEAVMDHFKRIGEANLAADPSLPDAASYHIPLLVFLEDDDMSIDMLNEDDMRAAGWVRASES